MEKIVTGISHHPEETHRWKTDGAEKDESEYGEGSRPDKMMKQIKEKINLFLGKCKSQIGKQKKIWLITSGIVIVIMIISIVLVTVATGKDEVTYKETSVVKGNLAEGVTESGSVDVGTTVQSFELDISEFAASNSFSFGDGSQNGMTGMMGMMAGQSGTQSSSDRTLEIEEVYVEAGQEIEAGAPILKLTKETVENIRSELDSDVTEAELVYNQAVTAKEQSDVDSEGTYQINVLYDSYAQAEYDQTVSTLTDAVTEAEEELAETEESLAEAEAELVKKEALLTEEKKVLENAKYSADGTDKETALYWWIVAYQTQQDAQDMVDTLEEEIEQLKEDIETYTEEKTKKETALALANEEREAGEISARGELDKRNYNALNAQEIYDVALEQSSFELETAQTDYEEAREKLQEFDSVIVDQVIYSTDNGVITNVYVAVGDVLTENTELISLNNYDEVTITVSVEEKDMDAAALGNKANVTLAAFPDDVFTGTVTEIGDAQIDSNTNKTLYSVTVTIEKTESLLYQDMTADVTFVTDEVSEVLYVPVRAVYDKDGTSYVKVKEENGSIVTRKVTTGFSDGINIEIKEGLSEGETVLLER
ncbi:MAG: efflux RND transporter periplasmic adaptor subunit [Suilimivivens sp.]